MGVLVAIAASAEIAKTTLDIADKLRTMMPTRAVVIQMHNHTEHELVMHNHQHRSGTFGELPSSHIPGQTVDVFGSRRRGRPEGARGSVTYRIADRQAMVTIEWSLRWRSWRSRSSSAQVTGRDAHRFAVTDLIGGSTSMGEARYELSLQEAPIVVDGTGSDGRQGSATGGGDGAGHGRPQPDPVLSRPTQPR